MTTPVRIDFLMRSPMVVPGTAKSLDALLSRAAFDQAEFRGDLDPIATHHDIGLSKHEHQGDWCFMASNFQYDWTGDTHYLHYIKRQTLDCYVDGWEAGVLKRRPYFDGATGQTKAGSFIQPLRWVSKVTAWAMVKDMHRVQELLPWVTHIGKLKARDFGAVKTFELHEDAQAVERWSHRNLPASSPFATQHARGIGGLVSPYWERSKHREIDFYLEP